MASMAPAALDCEVRELSPSEEYASFDSAAQYFLQISGKEFEERFSRGEFASPDSIPGVMEVLSLMPVTR